MRKRERVAEHQAFMMVRFRGISNEQELQQDGSSKRSTICHRKVVAYARSEFLIIPARLAKDSECWQMAVEWRIHNAAAIRVQPVNTLGRIGSVSQLCEGGLKQ